MWRKLSVRLQLVVLISLLLSFVEAGALGMAYWFDVRERRSLAIDQTQTLNRALNNDLLKALLNPQASVLADISFRLSGFDSLTALALMDGQNEVIYQYQSQHEAPGTFDVSGIGERALFSRNLLYLRQPLKSDGFEFGSVVYKLDLERYNTQLRQQLEVLFLAFPIELAFGLAMAWWVSRRYTQPFTELADAMRNSDVQHNQYQTVQTNAENEVADLYNGYNLLVRQIAQTTEGLRQAIVHKEHSEDANRAKSAFLANMSHELRTPLNAIIGYAEMISEGALDADREELIQDSQKIHVAGRHLLSLINNVLDLSKIEANKMEVLLEPVSVRALLDELAATIGPLIAKHHNQLSVSVGEGIDQITSDVTKLRQILINLTSNANKFTRNGQIHISVSQVNEGETRTTYFTIRDSGIGMSPDTLARLFSPFSQANAATSRDYGGTGLGLTISKRFCQILEGDISVESELGRGSAFTVRLPELVAFRKKESTNQATIV